MKSDESVLQGNLITNPIAIIGMASIFPEARTLPEYWNNILNKIDAIIDVPESRWIIDEYYDPNPAAPDKTYCKRGGFIPDVEFDPAQFGLPPNLLEVTDVSQLLSLVVAKECLDDAGYGQSREYMRDRTGVILGMVGIGSKLAIPLMARLQYPVWEKVLLSYGISAGDTQQIIHMIKLAYPAWEENSFPGSIGNVVAGRIANRLDLGGSNCVVDAACASSLAALRMAVSELIEGRADMMITGGVDTDNSIGTYMSFSKTPAFSKSENVRPFDQDSDGMMVGEGIGMVLLKRLADARRDGDRIYSVITGIGSSSDGRYKSIYAPRPSGQSVALSRAYLEAGHSPAAVGLIEAHGTGTLAGDPAEFEGMKEVFSKENPRKQHIALGSIKSQIGHTKAAAGVASLIKVSLALYHKVLPPTINVKKPHPKFDIENTPFYLNTETRPWIKPAQYPRRAGVSGFGFGGTNFHVVMEENESEHTQAYRLHTPTRVILISAPAPAELLGICQKLSNRLLNPKAEEDFAGLVKASWEKEISTGDARVGFTAANAEEAHRQLNTAIELIKNAADGQNAEHPSGIYYRRNSLDLKGKLVALFPGQGSQYINMGRELAMNFPPIRQAFADMDARFDAEDHASLTPIVYPIPAFDQAAVDRQNQQLTATEFAQPAIGTFSLGLYRLFNQAGFKADFTAGHSFGELTALWAAGVIDDAAFFTLSKARGKAMAPPADPTFETGTMLAVKGDITRLHKDLQDYPDVTLANWNSNSQVVLAGTKAAVAVVQKALTEKGYSVVPLPVSAAFHTPLVAHAQKPFASVIQKIQFNKPEIEVYSNTTGKKYGSDPDRIRQTLEDHVLQPVLFKDEIEAIYASGGSIFVEFGPKNILTNLVHNILEGKPHIAIAVNPNPKKDSDRQLRDAVAQLCVLGLDLRGYDPFALPERQKPERKKSGVTVKLNGGLYLSEKTRSAFKEAISGQNKLSNLRDFQGPVVLPGSPAAALESPAAVPASPEMPAAARTAAPLQESGRTNAGDLLNQIQSFQSEALKVHSQFLMNDGEYGRAYTRLVQQQLELLAANPSPQALEQIKSALHNLQQSLDQFHQHQAETLKVHEQYLRDQAELTSRMLQIAEMPIPSGAVLAQPARLPALPDVSQPAPLKPAHVPGLAVQPVMEQAVSLQTTQLPPIQSQAMADADELKNVLLDVVSEKTGYPAEMLDLGMDMEADLGIDSIKRVEIMGALQARYPDLPKIDAAALGEMRTLGQISEYMIALSASQTVPNIEMDQLSQTRAVSEPVSSGAALAAGVSIEEITGALLQIVSNKTGYPTEMLELGMDMEADLGIDSIKRVEIMGALQTQYPDLPAIDTTALAEMHTLGQIADYMNSLNASPSGPDQEMNRPVTAPAVSEQDLSGGGLTADVPVEEATHALLQIVSEKTGYPTEMLELDMDMEADLGIDSIKRVEIMGAMQASYPGLSQIDAASLAEMHTLGQIIEVLVAPKSSGEPAGETPALPVEEIETKSAGLARGVVTLKKIPAPDFLDIPVASGHICLITGNGTGLTIELADRLTGEGKQVVVLQLPPGRSGVEKLPVNIPNVVLKDWSESTLQQTLADIQKEHGPIAVFVHLDPAGGLPVDNSELENNIVKTTFLIAKYLKESLDKAARDGYAGFMTVTQMDGRIGLAPSGTVDPVSGALFGLVKTINLEWDRVFCRAVDLDPELDARTAAVLIAAELHDPNRLLSEISYHAGERFTLVVDQPAVEN